MFCTCFLFTLFLPFYKLYVISIQIKVTFMKLNRTEFWKAQALGKCPEIHLFMIESRNKDVEWDRGWQLHTDSFNHSFIYPFTYQTSIYCIAIRSISVLGAKTKVGNKTRSLQEFSTQRENKQVTINYDKCYDGRERGTMRMKN